MKKKLAFILLFMMCIIPAFSGYGVICEPCSECALSTYGGPIDPSPSEKAQKAVRSGWEKTTKAVQQAREKIAKTRQQITSATEKVQDTVVKAIEWPFEKATSFTKDTLGLNDKDSQNSKAQDNSAAKDTSVADRIDRNLDTYGSEKKGDYLSEHYSVEKRKYIRQQATIKLLARVLVLKNYFPEIEELISKVDEKTEESLKNSGGGTDGSMPESENEAKILKDNAELRMVWYRLLIFQKQIEAARLEFAANQALSNMKLVKKEPKVSSSQQGGSK